MFFLTVSEHLMFLEAVESFNISAVAHGIIFLSVKPVPAPSYSYHPVIILQINDSLAVQVTVS